MNVSGWKSTYTTPRVFSETQNNETRLNLAAFLWKMSQFTQQTQWHQPTNQPLQSVLSQYNQEKTAIQQFIRYFSILGYAVLLNNKAVRAQTYCTWKKSLPNIRICQDHCLLTKDST